MTSSARPNLGGLFNGSTPPQRPSRITDPVGPRLVSAAAGDEKPARSAPDAGDRAGKPANPPEIGSTPAGWIDPVNAVNQYFQFLRTLLDLNQQWAVACATAVVALPRRVGLHR